LTEDQVSGSTPRRYLARWAKTGLLAKVHALLVGMLRGHPDLVLDACTVRAKRGGAALRLPARRAAGVDVPGSAYRMERWPV
jgi:hypothetical protein